MIFALDLATNTGFAVGAPGTRPRTGTIRLKRPDEPQDVAFGNLIYWLNEEWTRDRPQLVVKEAPFSLQAFKERTNSQSGVELAYGLHAIVRGMCSRFGVRCEQAHPATIRKHFIGTAKLGDRAATKAAVIQRCRLLKLVPADCNDDNRCDAAATHDYACAVLCRRPPGKLVMFGEEARYA